MDCSLWKENLLGLKSPSNIPASLNLYFGATFNGQHATHMNPTALTLHNSNMRLSILQTACHHNCSVRLLTTEPLVIAATR